ncbi:MAG: alpha/beta hydrolase [Clostridia bacterium]|nr:alpha/beta hydrolase [Clostridia bacterium]
MIINVKGLNINYIDEGTGDGILLLHGWASSNQVYNGIINLMKDKYRLVAPDFPGCGGSQTMPTAWTLEDYVDFVLEFMEKVGLSNPILVGHSHGGRVILKLAADHKVLPPKIILLDSAGLIPVKTFKQKFRAKSFKFIKAVLTLPVIKSFSGKLLDKARAHYGSADYNAAPPVLRQTLVHLVNTDLRNIIHNIDCPTLLIWGDKDTATPLSDAKIIESKIKDCGLCVLEGAGHFAFCEQPYKAGAIIKSFLG